jgi:hypothetical protein
VVEGPPGTSLIAPVLRDDAPAHPILQPQEIHMSRITRVAVLATALMSLFGVLSSTAGAVVWHNNNDTAFTATAGASTFTVTGVSLTCGGANATGTAPAGSFTGATYTAMTLNANYTGCKLSGLDTAVSCGLTFTTSAVEISNTFDGSIHVNCGLTQFGTEICRIEGITSGSYKNPDGGILPTNGRLNFSHSNTLRTTNGTGAMCIMAPGEPLTLTAHQFVITGGGLTRKGPTIVRTP